MGGRRSLPWAEPTSVGKAARLEADRPAWNGRPARVEGAARLSISHAAGMRSRSRCEAHFDRLVEDEAQALRPRRPADEAINPSRQTIAQRKERSTPTVRRVSSGGSDQLQLAGLVSSDRRACHSNRRTGPGTKDQRQHRRLGPRRLRRACHSAGPAFPHGPPGESESSSGQARATGITHPGFYGRKPWKSLTARQLSPLPAPQERARTPPSQPDAKSFNKVHCRPSAGPDRPMRA